MSTAVAENPTTSDSKGADDIQVGRVGLDEFARVMNSQARSIEKATFALWAVAERGEYGQGGAYAKIAEITETPMGTVKSRIARAREADPIEGKKEREKAERAAGEILEAARAELTGTLARGNDAGEEMARKATSDALVGEDAQTAAEKRKALRGAVRLLTDGENGPIFVFLGDDMDVEQARSAVYRAIEEGDRAVSTKYFGPLNLFALMA